VKTLGNSETKSDAEQSLAEPDLDHITSIYLQGIANAKIIDTVHARRAPMIRVSSSLQL
jgi:hypothetical protein